MGVTIGPGALGEPNPKASACQQPARRREKWKCGCVKEERRRVRGTGSEGIDLAAKASVQYNLRSDTREEAR